MKKHKIQAVRSNADVMNVKKILLDQNVKTVENISTIRNNSHSHNEECYECEDCTKYFFAQNQHHLSN